MPGFGVTDNMVKSFRANRSLLKGSRKRLKRIFVENNYFYIRKKVVEKTKSFDPEQKRIFLAKFHAKQKKARTRQTFLFIIVFSLLGLIVYLIF